jgi:Icc-related predicted phosphoesterase
MKIALLSDTHGHIPPAFPQDETPDVICFCGDLFSNQDDIKELFNYSKYFNHYRERGVVVIGIGGNHDFPFEEHPDLPSQIFDHYLNNSYCEVRGVRFFGSPNTLLKKWAFYKSEKQQKEVFKDVTNVDVLLTHQPPIGVGDGLVNIHEHVGSEAVLELVKRVRPKYHVFGHIHEGYGSYKLHNLSTQFFNVAYCDRRYRARGSVPIIEY